MKALVYTAPNEVTYRDELAPSRAENEVLLHIDAAGICGSDMHAYHGHDPRRVPPLILGHELSARVVDGPGEGRRGGREGGGSALMHQGPTPSRRVRVKGEFQASAPRPRGSEA